MVARCRRAAVDVPHRRGRVDEESVRQVGPGSDENHQSHTANSRAASREPGRRSGIEALHDVPGRGRRHVRPLRVVEDEALVRLCGSGNRFEGRAEHLHVDVFQAM